MGAATGAFLEVNFCAESELMTSCCFEGMVYAKGRHGVKLSGKGGAATTVPPLPPRAWPRIAGRPQTPMARVRRVRVREAEIRDKRQGRKQGTREGEEEIIIAAM